MQGPNAAFRTALLAVLRWRYALLCAWLLYWSGRKLVQGSDWPLLNLGVELLFKGRDPRYEGPGWLHVFATEPALHMGPLSLVGAAAFRVLYPGTGAVGAAVFMCALGPLVVLLVERATLRARGLRDALDDPLLALVTLVSGAAFLVAWADVAWAFGRLDEVLVICGGAATLWLLVNDNPLLAGAAVGLSIGAKPWGVFLLPLLAALPWRQALRAGALAVAVAAAIWLPFVLADAGTIDAGLATAGVSVYPGSGPHLLGMEAWAAAPNWLRPAQTAVALALALLAIARGRWAATLLLAVGARLALDPAIIPYYTAALIFAALIWDLFGGRRPLPIWGVATVLAFYGIPELIENPQAEGVARVAVVMAAIAVVLGAPKAWLRRPTPTATSPG